MSSVIDAVVAQAEETKREAAAVEGKKARVEQRRLECADKEKNLQRGLRQHRVEVSAAETEIMRLESAIEEMASG